MVKSTELKHNSFWVAVDWGSTNLRYWLISKDTGKTILNGKKKFGVRFVSNGNFEEILYNLIVDFLPQNGKIDILCCGMVGSKQGWQEITYAHSPRSPKLAENVERITTDDPRLNVMIIPGLMQRNTPDIMRGEETQILGFLCQNPDFEGVICFTGTHSKWVKISDGEITFFKTFMTGEMFEILSKHSLLKFSVSSGIIDIEEARNAAIDILTHPHKFSSHLFGLRANDLLNNASPTHIKSRLSGYIIGLEIAGSKNFWIGNEVVIVGIDPITQIYQAVLEEQGIDLNTYLSDELSLSGLKATYVNLLDLGGN